MKTALLLVSVALAITTSQGASDKPYQMFTGTDIDLSVEGHLCRVEDVKAAVFIVNDKGHRRGVAMNRAGALRLVPSVKVVPTLVDVNALVFERAFTPDTNPQFQMASQMEATFAEQDNAERAQAAADGFKAETAPPNLTKAQAGVFNEMQVNRRDALQAGANVAGGMAGSDLGQLGIMEGKIQQRIAEELYDAMHITFGVSCGRWLNDPYVVATVHYHEPGKPPGPAHWWIYAEKLRPIEPEPHKVDILAGGLPPGFTYDRAQIHLYDHGSEVATNVSTNWISLSEDDAFLYLIADYMSAHRGANLAPAPVLRMPTAAERKVLVRAGSSRYVFVKVDKDGNATGAFMDEACTQPVPEGLVSITLLKVRFTPALQDGRPAPGVARLDLGT